VTICPSKPERHLGTYRLRIREWDTNRPVYRQFSTQALHFRTSQTVSSQQAKTVFEWVNLGVLIFSRISKF